MAAAEGFDPAAAVASFSASSATAIVVKGMPDQQWGALQSAAESRWPNVFCHRKGKPGLYAYYLTKSALLMPAELGKSMQPGGKKFTKWVKPAGAAALAPPAVAPAPPAPVGLPNFSLFLHGMQSALNSSAGGGGGGSGAGSSVGSGVGGGGGGAGGWRAASIGGGDRGASGYAGGSNSSSGAGAGGGWGGGGGIGVGVGVGVGVVIGGGGSGGGASRLPQFPAAALARAPPFVGFFPPPAGWLPHGLPLGAARAPFPPPSAVAPVPQPFFAPVQRSLPMAGVAGEFARSAASAPPLLLGVPGGAAARAMEAVPLPAASSAPPRIAAVSAPPPPGPTLLPTLSSAPSSTAAGGASGAGRSQRSALARQAPARVR